MSAIMHNEAFRKLKLDYEYILKAISPDELSIFTEKELRLSNFKGANVTIPHKIAIMENIDEIHSDALKIGAVNTIVNDSGILKGYNTDGYGALRALRESYGNLKNVKTVIFGAGGAARAITYHLSMEVDSIIILNRTLSKAIELADMVSNLPECKAEISARTFQAKSIKESLGKADILINSTPLGMRPNIDNSPVEKHDLRPDLFVFDMVYNPPITKLLRQAESIGAKTLTGVNMLVYQGAESFRLWTGLEAPENLMKKIVYEKLERIDY
jgi:shikimate dehydrogenase